MALVQVCRPGSADFENSNHPQILRVPGTNSPVVSLSFDDGSTESAFWVLITNPYTASANLRARIHWHADTATSGVVRWGGQLSALTGNTDSTSMEARTFGTAVEVNDTHLGTAAARPHHVDIDFNSAAELDNLAPDDELQLRIYREGGDAGDTMVGDARITKVEIFEI